MGRTLWRAIKQTNTKQPVDTTATSYDRYQETNYHTQPAEAIKADTETAVNNLHIVFKRRVRKHPKEQTESILNKLQKKGNLRDCILLSVPGKVLNRILLERKKKAVDQTLQDRLLALEATDHVLAR